MTTLVEEMAIALRETEGKFYLDMTEWPEHAGFADVVIDDRPLFARMHHNHIDLKFENARAVYRIDSHHGRVYHTTLVYQEGPCLPR